MLPPTHVPPLPPATPRTTGVLERLRATGVVKGWRDELYPLAPAFGVPPALLLERAAAPHFGMRAYGVHINGAPALGGVWEGGRVQWAAGSAALGDHCWHPLIII